ncbi:MAG: hypothetical protein IPK78_20380 [Rhodospirillales bacterium]|nr:hypothetical protein [Rhodospirillales bacterium]
MLPEPALEDLIRIATAHFGPEKAGDKTSELYEPLAEQTMLLKDEHRKKGIRPPSTAEYLDAVRACLKLRIDPKDDEYSELLGVTLEKSEKRAGSVGGPR